MLTSSALSERENVAIDQGFTTLGEIIGGVGVLTYVKQSQSISEAKPAQPPALQGRSGEQERVEAGKAQLRKDRNKGGWGTTSYIDHDLWKLTRSQLIEIGRARYAPTIFATLRRPPGLSDTEAKKWIRLQLARLGQSLERKGHLYVALTVYEKKLGGLLHAHALIYVHPDLFHIVARWADYFEHRLKCSRALQKAEEPDVAIHARRAVETDSFYILKQHRYCGPKEPQSRGPWWEKSEPITGARVTWSGTARAILAGRARPIVEKSSISKQLHRKTQETLPPVEPFQLALPLDLDPVPPILKLVEEKRVEQQLTQREAARLLGIKQAGYSNAVVRQHDRLSPWAMNRAREYVADRLAA